MRTIKSVDKLSDKYENIKKTNEEMANTANSGDDSLSYETEHEATSAGLILLNLSEHKLKRQISQDSEIILSDANGNATTPANDSQEWFRQFPRRQKLAVFGLMLIIAIGALGAAGSFSSVSEVNVLSRILETLSLKESSLPNSLSQNNSLKLSKELHLCRITDARRRRL